MSKKCFEEQFPGLKGKLYNCKFIEGGEWVELNDLKQNCLDKSLVLKAIENSCIGTSKEMIKQELKL